MAEIDALMKDRAGQPMAQTRPSSATVHPLARSGIGSSPRNGPRKSAPDRSPCTISSPPGGTAAGGHGCLAGADGASVTVWAALAVPTARPERRSDLEVRDERRDDQLRSRRTSAGTSATPRFIRICSTQAQRRVGEAVAEGLLIDGSVNSCGDDVNLVMTHRHGVDAEPVHHFAWDTFVELTEVAKRLHLYGAGQDLLADAFSGNVRGAGPGVAELEILERPSEPFIVFAADKTSPGAWNLPLYKIFCDPFNTAGLIIDKSMHAGFTVEVHDLIEHQRAFFHCPEDLYDLLVYIGTHRGS